MKREIYNRMTEEKFSLSYYLVKTEVENEDEGFSIETYGVEIEKIINLNILEDKTEDIEENIPYTYIYENATVPDIATSKDDIFSFLKMLFQKSIQPFNLREEVIKWLG